MADTYHDKQIMIGGLPYLIQESTPVRGDRNEELHGDICYYTMRIRIDGALTEPFKRRVLLHEILHGVAEQAAVNQKEKVIHRMAHLLDAVLADNPWLLSLYAPEDGHG